MMECEEARLLLQAELDGELEAGRAAALAAHAAGCAGCARARRELSALSTRLRAEAPYHAAPAALRARLEAQLGVAASAPRRRAWWRGPMAGFAAGFALAAGLAAFTLLPRSGEELGTELVAGHVRALQASHLVDVPSSDQHQVKPWFLGRLDYAPPVRELPGYVLVGGRLDYLRGRAVAALVYRRGQHAINLYVWPEAGDDGREAPAEIDGYNLLRWSQDGMVFWAVSDLNRPELEEFVREWHAAS